MLSLNHIQRAQMALIHTIKLWPDKITVLRCHCIDKQLGV